MRRLSGEGQNPSGLCLCGCGRVTRIATTGNSRRGDVRGQHVKYAIGHSSRVTPTPCANPTGLCQCGCGERTPLAPGTDSRRGWVKGQPIKYIAGHCGTRHWMPDYVVDAQTGCWVWQKGVDASTGYGRFAGDRHAHRAYMEKHEGRRFASSEIVHHECENKLCVNPAHMVLTDRLAHMNHHLRESAIR